MHILPVLIVLAICFARQTKHGLVLCKHLFLIQLIFNPTLVLLQETFSASLEPKDLAIHAHKAWATNGKDKKSSTDYESKRRQGNVGLTIWLVNVFQTFSVVECAQNNTQNSWKSYENAERNASNAHSEKPYNLLKNKIISIWVTFF